MRVEVLPLHTCLCSSGNWDWLRAITIMNLNTLSRTVPVPPSADVEQRGAVETEGH